MLLLVKSFTTEPVMPQIVRSFPFHVVLSLFLLLLNSYLDICINYLFSVESHLHIHTS